LLPRIRQADRGPQDHQLRALCAQDKASSEIPQIHRKKCNSVFPMRISTSGFLDAGTSFKNPNFAAMAEAVGVRGIRLETPGEVDKGIAEALAHDGPVLVDAVVSQMVAPSPGNCRRRPTTWSGTGRLGRKLTSSCGLMIPCSGRVLLDARKVTSAHRNPPGNSRFAAHSRCFPVLSRPFPVLRRKFPVR
jgi:hypothetical protein